MEAFKTHTGLVAPFDRANVDTDLIIPKQFLKSIERTGFGENLFDQLRYKDEGQPGMDCSTRPRNPDFILHQPRYAGASILLTRENFGCGSSREHAPWALLEYGFKVLIGPSFADIFYNNCFKNGILPVVLDNAVVERLFAETTAKEGYTLTVDLEQQTIRLASGEEIAFELDPPRRQKLIEGLDDIGQTLLKVDAIRDYEQRAAKEFPWLFTDLAAG